MPNVKWTNFHQEGPTHKEDYGNNKKKKKYTNGIQQRNETTVLFYSDFGSVSGVTSLISSSYILSNLSCNSAGDNLLSLHCVGINLPRHIILRLGPDSFRRSRRGTFVLTFWIHHATRSLATTLIINPYFSTSSLNSFGRAAQWIYFGSNSDAAALV